MIHAITPYQFLIPAFALFMVGRMYSKWTHKQRSTRELLVLTIFWGVISFFSLYPDVLLERITFLTGIKNGVYAIIFFGLIVLFYVVFTVLIKIEHMERAITDMVRREAIEQFMKSPQG